MGNIKLLLNFINHPTCLQSWTKMRTHPFKILLQETQQRSFSTSKSFNMPRKYFLLTYQYVADVLEKRAPFRPEHLAQAQRYTKEGKLVLGGAFCDPLDSAGIVFHVENKEEIEAFVKSDPYVINGIVTDWKIREWTVVVGSKLEV